MGKAKRFNSYDATVAEGRKLAQSYGAIRQNLSIGSSVRSMPLSPNTGSFTAGTFGTATSYYFIPGSTDQTTIGSGVDLKFDGTQREEGTDISYNKTTGEITLQPGHYELSYTAHFNTFSNSTGGGIQTQFVDTSNVKIPNTARTAVVPSTNTNSVAGTAENSAILDPTVATTYKIRTVNAVGTADFVAAHSWLRIIRVDIAGTGSGGGSGVSFPITPSINDHGNVGTTTEDLDLSASTGHVHKITLTGNPTLTFSNPPTSGTQMEFEIEFVQDATGGRTVTWPASVVETVTISTAASTTTIITVRTNDGGTTYHAIPALRGSITLAGSQLLSNITIDTDFDANGLQKFVLDADADTYIIGDTDDQIEFFTAGTEKVRINTELQLQGGTNLDLNGNDLVFGTGSGEYMDHGASSNIRVYVGSAFKAEFNATGLSLQSGYRLIVDDYIALSPITAPSVTGGAIFTENLTNDELVLNAPTSGKVRMDIAGTEIADFGATAAQFQSTLGYDITFFRDNVSPLDDDNITTLDFQGNDSGAGADIYARIAVIQTDVTAGTEDGDVIFSVANGGTLDEIMRLDGSVLEMKLSGAIDMQGNDIDGIGALNMNSPPDITGSRGGNAALADLLTSLASIGLITDSST
jgi:hypothetical protein